MKKFKTDGFEDLFLYPESKNRQLIFKYLVLVISVFSLVVIGFCLYLYLKHYPNLNNVQNLIIPDYRVVLNPSFKEHFIFFGLLLIAPILILSIVLLTKYLISNNKLSDNFYFYWQIIFVCLFVLIFYAFIRDFFNLFPFPISITKLMITILLFFLIVFPKKNFNISHQLSFRLLIGLSIFQAFCFRIFTLNVINDGPIWSQHFDPVFYSLVQVVAGKTVLADFNSQYGFYSELLKPLFQMFPLTVFNFTLILSILEILALFSIAKTLIRFVHNRLLILISLIGLVFLTGMNWKLVDFYFQYWPLRFFFPACSLFLLVRLLDQFTPKNVILLSIISSVAVIWNIDSGISVLGSYLIFLIAQIIFPNKPQLRLFYFKMLFLALITSAIIFIGFFDYLELKTPRQLHWNEILNFQKIFFLSGFMKINLPLYLGLPSWMFVAGVYLLGFVHTFTDWINKRHSKVDSLIFYLTVMGCGLFCYYQGRSHNDNLVAVLWPALVISLILIDQLLRAIKLKRLSSYWNVLTLPVIFFVSYLSLQFITTLPKMTQLLFANWKLNLFTASTPLMENIQFINSQVKDRNSVVILTRNQSVYYNATGLVSAIESPGLVQMLTTPELNHLISQLSEHPVKHLFISPYIYTSGHDIPKLLKPLLKYYQIKKQFHDIYYLEPKQ